MACIFCDIISGKVPAKKVHEDARFLAFEDIAPQAPVHVVVIPKEHMAGLMDMKDEGAISGIFGFIRDVARKQNVDGGGFRVVVNSGKNAGQAVAHLHFHLIGGRTMEWPPG